MRYEEAQGILLPKVGFGTWSIGGRETPDANQDANSLAALRSALALGYTHFDTAETYAGGHCEELIGRSIRAADVARSTLFLTSKVKPEHLDPHGVTEACEASLKRLQTDYIDLYLIHWPNRSIRLQETFAALNRLWRQGKVRHLGVSNFDLPLLQEAESLSEPRLLTNQVPLSVFERTYTRNGVLQYCQSRGITVTAYSPVKSKQLQTDPQVARLAAARELSAHQVGIAWLCSQPGVITIPMSTRQQHQQENLEAADVLLTAAELSELG